MNFSEKAKSWNKAKLDGVSQSALIRRWAAMTKWLRRKQQIYKRAEANIGKWKWRTALVFVAPPYLLLVLFAEALMWTGEHIEDAGYWIKRKLP